MSTEQIMQLTYLVLLAAAIGGSYIVAQRDNMGKMAQQAVIWGLIFVGVVGAYGLWDDISRDATGRQALISDNQVAVPLRNDGHYYLTLDINGTPVEFAVDTGASQVVLSQEDARRVGFDPATLNYSGVALTANGRVRTAPVTLESVALGALRDDGLRAVVNEGAMDGSLLGMTYLNRYSRIEIMGNELVLTR
ncbi:TIGR02281 family clan AA aspartic protease [Yoonia sp. SS1-5]|uniref:TIGR02281 family clan AA aspartic protease n=1 Tax=Yoonia rhodophyticola TaxID=3137370 RepID=A0AAN0M7L2_9RHOB